LACGARKASGLEGPLVTANAVASSMGSPVDSSPTNTITGIARIISLASRN
jgi:hypothetical protein